MHNRPVQEARPASVAGFTTRAHSLYFLIGRGIDRLLAEAASDIDLVLGPRQLLLPAVDPSEAAAVEIVNRLDDLLPRVHHERSVPDDGLVERLPVQQQ